MFFAASILVLPPLGYLLWLTQRPGWVQRERVDANAVLISEAGGGARR